MILTRELDDALHRPLVRRLCCPICLSSLIYSFVDQGKGRLYCDSCKNSFFVADGLPYFLIEDENLEKKKDEIYGEEEYNRKVIPLEVHIERNAFVNDNTVSFLGEAGVNLSHHEILIVGCSMAELDCFLNISENVTALDIVPSLARDCYKATRDRGIQASWICGDGECLPFEDESFDAVIVRQTLHHMLKYYSAICEFFRVCRRDGSVLIIDEPYSPPSPNDSVLQSIPDSFVVYDGLPFGKIRKKFNIPLSQAGQNGNDANFLFSETGSNYIKPDRDNPETFLADKYHAFSVLNCVRALRWHTEDITLNWPREVAWNDESRGVIRFRHGPNPNYKKSLLDKLTAPGNVSIAARKSKRTSVLRSRHGLKAAEFETFFLPLP